MWSTEEMDTAVRANPGILKNYFFARKIELLNLGKGGLDRMDKSR